MLCDWLAVQNGSYSFAVIDESSQKPEDGLGKVGAGGGGGAIKGCLFLPEFDSK